MSDGNRGGDDQALGNTLSILAAIFLVAFIVGTLAFSQGEEAERRNQAPADYASAAQQNAMQSCGGREAGAMFECVYEIVESGQQQAQAEQDLDAQQGMKFWAAIMAILTGLTVAVTAAGVWFVKGTLDATLKAVEETTKATEAMVEGNRITRKVAEAELRPYIFVERLNFVLKSGDLTLGVEDEETGEWRRDSGPDWLLGEVEIHLRNFGKVPARNITVHMLQYHLHQYTGRFSKAHRMTIENLICAPNHERRVFGRLHIMDDERSDFDAGLLRWVISLSFTFEDDEGAVFRERARYAYDGRDTETFYLLNRYPVQAMRDSAAKWDLYERGEDNADDGEDHQQGG